MHGQLGLGYLQDLGVLGHPRTSWDNIQTIWVSAGLRGPWDIPGHHGTYTHLGGSKFHVPGSISYNPGVSRPPAKTSQLGYPVGLPRPAYKHTYFIALKPIKGQPTKFHWRLLWEHPGVSLGMHLWTQRTAWTA